jgi:hypothetical protein
MQEKESDGWLEGSNFFTAVEQLRLMVGGGGGPSATLHLEQFVKMSSDTLPWFMNSTDCYFFLTHSPMSLTDNPPHHQTTSFINLPFRFLALIDFLLVFSIEWESNYAHMSVARKFVDSLRQPR